MRTEIVKMQKFIVNNRTKSDPNNNAAAVDKKPLSPLNDIGESRAQCGDLLTAPATTSPTKPIAGPSPIKMSGYLKKKRNRVGGWRKLWFVLQNQLLLSYSSKEDYEKKLAPFKDVINLVPGTTIKPAPGARFTLETTSNMIFIFRCDNSKICSEWITAICESLGIKGRKSIQCLTSQKWSLNRPPVKQGMKIPKLPIAKNTARIIERGVVVEPIDHIAKVQQDFRLHQAELILGKQSGDVCRINRMFVAPVRPKQNEINRGNSAVIHPKDLAKSSGKVLVTSSHNNFPRKMETLKECEIEEQMQCMTLDDMSLFSERDDQLEEEEEGANRAINIDDNKMHLETGKNGDSSNVASSQSLSNEPIYAVVDLKNKYERRAKLNKHTEVEEGDETEEECGRGQSPNGRLLLQPATKVNTITENGNCRHDANREDDNRNSAARLERPKSFQVFGSDYEEVGNFPDLIFSEPNSSEENIYEPINIPEELTRETHKNLWRYFPKINLETLVELTRWRHTNHNGSNCNSQANESPTEPAIPPRLKLSPNSPCGTTSSSSASSNASSFSEMRKKWGSHRKSIKNRVKKMYNKTATDQPKKEVSKSCELPVIKDSDRVLPFSNNCLTKRDKTLFSSLTRLRKSRTSICIEEIGPKQKKLLVQQRTTRIFTKIPNNDPQSQQKTDRRQKDPSFFNGKNVCHSKFYD